MLPNRLERHWEAIKPQILDHWRGLSKYDLVGINGRFDRLVSLINYRAMPGRSAIVTEAEIKDWLVGCLTKLEQEG